MNEFGKREIFVDLSKLYQSTRTLGIYLICFLIANLLGLFIIDEAHFILIFLLVAGLLGLKGLWKSYHRTLRTYQNQPYMIMDEAGLTINEPACITSIRWQAIITIDMKIKHSTGRREIYHVIKTAEKEYRLNEGMLDNFNDTLVLLKRYAEHYGTARFIY